MKKIEDNNTLVSQTHSSLHAGRTHSQRPVSSFYIHCLQAQHVNMHKLFLPADVVLLKGLWVRVLVYSQ